MSEKPETICHHDPEVARDVLEYCKLDASGGERAMAPIVALESRQTRSVIRTSRREFGKCEDVFIHPKTVNAPADDEPVKISDATEWQFFRYRFGSDRRRRIALYGFILAIISVLVDGAVLLGDKGIGFPTAAWWIETMRILALFGKLIGLGVAFYEGLLKE